MITEIFQYEFMRMAFGVGIIVGMVAPIVGSFLVMKRYSLIADTLAHVSLLGVALGSFLNLNPTVTATLTATTAALGIEKLRAKKKGSGDTILAMFLSGSLALAATIMAASGKGNQITYYLFGSIATGNQTDLILMMIIGAAVLGIITFGYKELFTVSLDEETAKANGINSGLVNGLLAGCSAITVAISIRTVGALLIGALTTIPVLSSMNLAKSFKGSVILSIIFSEISVIIGLLLSYYLDVASGSMIVIISICLYGISLLLKD